MFKSLSDDVQECYRRAQECAHQAKRLSDPEFRKDFLNLERRWLRLARNYQLSELALKDK
jgi:hypothetical protein